VSDEGRLFDGFLFFELVVGKLFLVRREGFFSLSGLFFFFLDFFLQFGAGVPFVLPGLA